MEGIRLPSTLSLLLRSGSGSPEGERECLLQSRLTLDLAAADPAQPAAQDAQLPLMPPELLCVGASSCHQPGALGHARIGCRSLTPCLLATRLSPLIWPRATAWHRSERRWPSAAPGVDRAPLEVQAAHAGLMRSRWLSASSSSSLSPSRLRQWLSSERSCGKACWKNSSREELEMRVVDPTLAHPSSDNPKMCLSNSSPIMKPFSSAGRPFSL